MIRMPRLLIVGSGVTGALTASLVRQERKDLEIVVWDKAKGAGGRMSTSRSPTSPSCIADLGAQYLTATPDYVRSHAQFYEDLIESELLQPMISKFEGMKKVASGTLNFVTPNGSGSLVKYYLNKSGAEVHFEHEVESIQRSEKSHWLVTTSSGASEKFEAVVMTVPVPQLFQLKGAVPELLAQSPEITEKLKNIFFSSRYALGLFYDDCPGFLNDLPWAAKYFPDDPMIRFIAVDNFKRGSVDQLPAVVVHTSVTFGQSYLEDDKDKVQGLIVNHLPELLPGFVPPSSMKCQRWRYSQVKCPFENTPGCVTLQESPLLALGGDSFTHSNFDGCVDSAIKIVEEILKKL
ncbi:renalase-like isoform X1 [Limulus polyphemus]|uniref:Renalase-like isoform X1 n=2 Tax=Limulus polyphemus TaxID=6850 RepID=A0ABM1TAP4_LIMPO|nr:renalase-like isoform X1 [Limulus polyphemus]XP_022252949.1 renalase-like isoform X1 [Limulus polyphemus]XP_022252950.1 renalase-like isoform X1 [Limulus polyphemus]